MENLLNSFNSNKHIIKKSIAELRTGIPVLLYNNKSNLLVFPSEMIDNQILHKIQKYSDNAYILITGNRLNFLLQSSGNQLSRITLKESYNIDYISYLLTGKKLHSFDHIDTNNTTVSTNPLDITSISLIKLTKLLPSAI
ncbi:GTP cyclohydrolase II, partial [Ehrlichia ruminantium]